MQIGIKHVPPITMGFLSLGVGLVALRFVLPQAGMAPEIAANAHAGFLPLHAVAGGLALLLGPFQFLGRGPVSRPRWHRITGRIYAAACLIGAPAGFILALGSTAGPVATLGFGSLAVMWFGSTLLGLAAAMQGRFGPHQRWMIRSYALAFAAVTLRLYLPPAAALPVDYTDAYRAISFLCWMPNLAVAEWIVTKRRLPRNA